MRLRWHGPVHPMRAQRLRKRRSITSKVGTPGTAIEILTARDDTKSPSFFIEPSVLAVKDEANRKIDNASPARTANPASDHPIGVERVTGIQLIRPKEYQPVAAFAYLEKAGLFKSTEGKEWAIEISFDGRRKAQTKDLRPDLPLIIHY